MWTLKGDVARLKALAHHEVERLTGALGQDDLVFARDEAPSFEQRA